MLGVKCTDLITRDDLSDVCEARVSEHRLRLHGSLAN